MMLSIDHINRFVSNVDKFIDFYCDILKYDLLDKGIKSNGYQYAILKGHGHELYISEKDNFLEENEKNFRHIGYCIENVDELIETFKLKGYIDIEIEQQIIIKPYSKQFYIKDPDGFEIDLIEWTDKQGFYNNLKRKNIK